MYNVMQKSLSLMTKDILKSKRGFLNCMEAPLYICLDPVSV